MLINVSASSSTSTLSQSRRGLEPLLRSEPPLQLRREGESSLEGDLPSSDRNARVLRAGDPSDPDRERLPGLDAGELYTAVKKTSGTLVGELRKVLVDRCEVVPGMMNQEARAECRIKPNDKLQGVSVK